MNNQWMIILTQEKIKDSIENLNSKVSAKISQDQSGQSTIEFALTMILLLGFVVFFFQLSMIFAFGNYVHYATFMSARAYLSSSQTQEDQMTRAKDVLVAMVKKNLGMSGIDKFPTIASAVGIEGDFNVPGFQINPPSQYVAKDRRTSWMQGVRYTFSSKVFVLPLAGFSKAVIQKVDSSAFTSGKATSNRVKLTSESWLGREPSTSECVSYLSTQGGLYDNGC